MISDYKVHINGKSHEEYFCFIGKISQMNKCVQNEESIQFARSFCYSVVNLIWEEIGNDQGWKCRDLALPLEKLDDQNKKLAEKVAAYFITLNTMEYSYMLGNLYTMLLPDGYRSERGIYYTPPALAERLLDLLAAEGADWVNAKILDPACGGGAFLLTIVNRVLGDYRIRELTAENKLQHIESHLFGFEIDEFAAWLTQTLLDIILYRESCISGRRLKNIVRVQNTISAAMTESRKFDIIVGNPPYGRIKLDAIARDFYKRSLYGHANMYGLFIDASLRMKKKNGLIGYVLPTSFLGGKYYENLRKIIYQIAPVLTVDFVELRTGVFEQVLQETCLVVFGVNSSKTILANRLEYKGDQCRIDRIGNFKLESGGKPWVIARDPKDVSIINQVTNTGNTLEQYGYKVSTGQLVWNRLKEQIRPKKEAGVKPIIWAEAISSDGSFNFDYHTRRDKKYIKISEKQDFLICKKSVVLVQRTSSKEQRRRLQSCVLPADFVQKWSGAVIENHVNIVQPIDDAPAVSLEVLSLILNSNVVDRVFRCFSGSVAVSASELLAMPLPPLEEIMDLNDLIENGDQRVNTKEKIEQYIEKAYGVEAQDYGNME